MVARRLHGHLPTAWKTPTSLLYWKLMLLKRVVCSSKVVFYFEGEQFPHLVTARGQQPCICLWMRPHTAQVRVTAGRHTNSDIRTSVKKKTTRLQILNLDIILARWFAPLSFVWTTLLRGFYDHLITLRQNKTLPSLGSQTEPTGNISGAVNGSSWFAVTIKLILTSNSFCSSLSNVWEIFLPVFNFQRQQEIKEPTCTLRVLLIKIHCEVVGDLEQRGGGRGRKEEQEVCLISASKKNNLQKENSQ